MPVEYEFGPFRLDAKLGILLRGTEPIGVGQRAVALLRLLVERAGEPVGKEDLIAAAWPGLDGRGQQPNGANDGPAQGAQRGRRSDMD